MLTRRVVFMSRSQPAVRLESFKPMLGPVLGLSDDENYPDESVPAVATLSDEENVHHRAPEGKPERQAQKVAGKRPQTELSKALRDPARVRARITKLVGSRCPCLASTKSGTNCLAQFRDDVDELVALRLELGRLHAEDMDNRAP